MTQEKEEQKCSLCDGEGVNPSRISKFTSENGGLKFTSIECPNCRGSGFEPMRNNNSSNVANSAELNE